MVARLHGSIAKGTSVVPEAADADPSRGATAPMATPIGSKDYTDNRALWDWQSKYPPDARKYINREAVFLTIALVISLILGGVALCFAGHPIKVPFLPTPNAEGGIIESRLLVIFFVGCVGGTTFSIKWLIHTVAKGMWHLDRSYWRKFVPLIGGVYACVVLTLFDVGLIAGQTSQAPRTIASAAAFAFLVGYFSDGVSGLLTNIANAVFGTLKEK